MAFCTQADLEIALGGAKILRELADPNNTGTPDATTVADWLEAGASQIRAAAEIKHDPEVLANLDAPSLTRLKKANARLSARVAYEDGGKGLAMPDQIAKRADWEDEYLEMLAAGRRRLGRAAGGISAAINQPAVGALSYDNADTYSQATGGNVTANTGSGQGRPSTSGISIDAYRANGFR